MSSFDSLLNRAFKEALLRRLSDESRMPSTPRTVREPSTTERNEEYHPSGYGLLFCTHGRSWFEKCAKCKRTAAIAKLQYERFCNRHGLPS